jgi:hypothetical protein
MRIKVYTVTIAMKKATSILGDEMGLGKTIEILTVVYLTWKLGIQAGATTKHQPGLVPSMEALLPASNSNVSCFQLVPDYTRSHFSQCRNYRNGMFLEMR